MNEIRDEFVLILIHYLYKHRVFPLILKEI